MSTFKKIGFDFTNNQLFEKSLIFDLFCDATTLTNSGKPAVVFKEYTTLENKHWGIQAQMAWLSSILEGFDGEWRGI